MLELVVGRLLRGLNYILNNRHAHYGGVESTAALGRGRSLATSVRMRERHHRQGTYFCLTKDHTYIHIMDNNSVFNTHCNDFFYKILYESSCFKGIN